MVDIHIDISVIEHLTSQSVDLHDESLALLWMPFGNACTGDFYSLLPSASWLLLLPEEFDQSDIPRIFLHRRMIITYPRIVEGAAILAPTACDVPMITHALWPPRTRCSCSSDMV